MISSLQERPMENLTKQNQAIHLTWMKEKKLYFIETTPKLSIPFLHVLFFIIWVSFFRVLLSFYYQITPANNNTFSLTYVHKDATMITNPPDEEGEEQEKA